MTRDQAKRILDRARDGNDIPGYMVSEALRVSGDVSRWIAKDFEDGVRIRVYSSPTDGSLKIEALQLTGDV